MTRLEKRLLKYGTYVGPVTPEMIKLAKTLELGACKACGYKTKKDGWLDFLPEARDELS